MIDVVYLAQNRLEFTRATFGLLVANTNWDLVDRFVVYDDLSEDGTREWLEGQVHRAGVEFELRLTNRRSPVKIMNDYVRLSVGEWFAKIDSDIAVPPGWLDELAGVVGRNPEIELLGMEAGRTGFPGSAGGEGSVWRGERGWIPATHIGGVGLMRAESFRRREPIPARGRRFGFTEWQTRNDLVRGWVCPDLMVPQLDRVPIEPWASLSAEYVALGWQRPWPVMDARWTEPYWGWLEGVESLA